MNKQLYTLLFILCFSQFSFAQIIINCNGNLNMTIGLTGEIILEPEMLLEGTVNPDYTYEISPSTLDCSHVGLSTVVTIIAWEGSESEFCESIIAVADLMQPIAIADNLVTVTLDNFGYADIDPAAVDEGSYDNCTDVTLSVSPDFVDCNSVFPVEVTLTVTDEYGNSNQALTLVTANNNVALACNDQVYIPVFNDPVEVLPSDILEGGPYPCIDNYTVTLTLNGTDLPTPFVSTEHLGETIECMITDPATGNKCWGNIQIIGGNINSGICIQNLNGEALPDVVIKDGFITDNTGCVDSDLLFGEWVIPTKEDIVTNGLDIGDEILLYEYVLGAASLDPVQLAAGNLGNPPTNTITTLDVVILQKVRMGLDDIPVQWIFFDADQPLEPNVVPTSVQQGFHIDDLENINLIGAKMGDINNSHELNFTGDTDVEFSITDQILNQGETLIVTMEADIDKLTKGFEFIIPENSQAFDIIDVTSNLEGFNFNPEFNIASGDTYIRWICPDLKDVQNVDKIVIEVEILANKNTILSDEFAFESVGRDKLIQKGGDDLYLGINWDEKIVLDNQEIAIIKAFEIAPNPAIDVVKIQSKDGTKAAIQVHVLDVRGSLIDNRTMFTGQEINIQNWSEGIYIFQIQSEEGIQFEKIVKM